MKFYLSIALCLGIEFFSSAAIPVGGGSSVIQVSGSATMGGGIVLTLSLGPSITPSFYGLTSAGGIPNGLVPNGNGTFFGMDTAGNVSVLYAFPFVVNQEVPVGSVIQATDGNLYGITQDGGANSKGTIFRMTTAGAYTLIHSFLNATDGGFPNPNLIQASDGNLYGMASQGGSTTLGTLFKCTLDGTFSVLHTFTGASDGSNPFGTVVQASDGSLYGMTSSGGTNSNGTIFKVTLGGSLTPLYSFTAAATSDGKTPLGELIQASDGNFYGMTSAGGTSGRGTIFKVTSAGAFTTLRLLATADGIHSSSALVQGADGALYGMCKNGGVGDFGTIFKITTAGTFTLLYTLVGGTDGQWPDGPLIQSSTDGNLYGCTSFGGTGNRGTAFSITTNGTFTLLHTFIGPPDGGIPNYCKLFEPRSTPPVTLQQFGGTGADMFRTMTTDSLGNVYTAGTFSGTFSFGGTTVTSAGGRDMFLAKFNQSGVLQWVQPYGSTGDEVPIQIVLGTSGNLYVGGLFTGTANFGGTNTASLGSTDGFVAKYTSSGAFVWSQAVGGTGADQINGIALDNTEGKILTIGMFSGTVVFTPTNTFASQSGGNDSYIASYTTSGGTPIWAETWGSLDYDTGINIFCDTNNNVTVMGAFAFTLGTNMLSIQSYIGTRDLYIGRFTSVGNNAPGVASWAKGYGTLNNTIPTCSAMDPAGNITVGGTFITQSDVGSGVLSGTGSYSTFLAKYSGLTGTNMWSRAINSNWTVSPSSIAFDPSSNLVVGGAFAATCNFGNNTFTEVGNTGNGDGFVARYSGSNGAAITAQSFGGTLSDSANAVVVDGLDYITASGYFSGTANFGLQVLTSAGSTDAFIQKISP